MLEVYQGVFEISVGGFNPCSNVTSYQGAFRHRLYTSMAESAEPILASALWTAHQAADERTIETSQCNATTGVPSIDTVFSGVLQYGTVCCVSAEANSGGCDFCVAYLVSHLLSSPSVTATVIDTALSFDVRKLHQLLVSRLRGQVAAEQLAMQALERLNIMKVFDFEGLAESILELRSSLEGDPRNAQRPMTGQKPPRGTIGDSEDEDEMLDSPSPPPELQVRLFSSNTDKYLNTNGLLIIDSISQVAAPMMRNRYVEGQALLISFMRSLTHLTRANGLLTIMLNDATTRPNDKDELPSIFTICKARPALGRSFEHMLDTHLLVHRASATTTNQQLGRSQSTTKAGGSKIVSVAEVLQNRHGGALGRWVAFTADEGGDLEAFD